MQAPLFIEDVKSLASKLIEFGSKDATKNMEAANATKEVRDAVAELFKTLGRTVDDGNLDLAASLRGPDKNEQYTAVGAFSLKDPAALEKSLKAAIKIAPNEVAGMIKFDAFKVGAINVHEIAVGEMLPPEAQKIFSKSSVYVAATPTAVFVTFGASAKDVMKEVLTQKLSPKPAPLLQAEVSGKRLMPLIKHTGAPLDGPGGQFFAKFAAMDRVSLLTYKVEGRDNKLVLRQEMGLVPLMGMFGLVRLRFAPVLLCPHLLFGRFSEAVPVQGNFGNVQPLPPQIKKN